MNRFMLTALILMSAVETEVSAGAVNVPTVADGAPVPTAAEKKAADKAAKDLVKAEAAKVKAAEKEAKAAAKVAEAEAKAAAKAAAEVAKVAEKEVAKVSRERANGQTRPTAGSKTGKIWEIADTLSKALKRPAERAEVMAEAAKLNPPANTAMAATQYGRWCLFYGVKKTRVMAVPVVAPVTEQAPSVEQAPVSTDSDAVELVEEQAV